MRFPSQEEGSILNPGARSADAEYIYFENEARVLDKLDPSGQIKGSISIIIDQKPCPECQNMIIQFHSMFPNIEIDITYLNLGRTDRLQNYHYLGINYS
jgi:hypothetical protein